MSALENDIIQKFRLLDKEARDRVLLQIAQETQAESISPSETTAQDFLMWARGFRARTESPYEDRPLIDAADLINEMREERLDDIMGGR